MSEAISAGKPGRLRRWSIRILKTLAVLAVLLAAFHLEENWRGERAYRRAYEDWRAAGHPGYEAVFSDPPSVPPERNLLEAPCFSTWRIATPEYTPSGVDRFGKWLTLMARAHVYGDWTRLNWRALYAADGGGSPAIRREPTLSESSQLIGIIEKDYPEISGLVTDEGSRREAVFTVPWPSRGRIASASLPPFRDIRNTSMLLALYGEARLAEGDARPALAASRASLRLCHALDSRPGLISGMTGVVAAKLLPIPIIHSGLASGLWHEADLAGLETLAADYRPVAAVRRSLEAEAMFSMATMESMSRSGFFEHLNWDEPGHALALLTYSAAPLGWRYANGVACLGYFDRMIASVFSGADGIDLPALHRSLADIQNSRTWPTNYIAKLSLPACPKIIESASAAQTKLDCVRLGVALERYRLKTGGFPESLDGLVPGYLARIPPGTRRGQSPKYVKNKDGGYTLTYRSEGYEPARPDSKPDDDLEWIMPAPGKARPE